MEDPFFFSKFVHRMSLFVARSVALNPFCQGLLIEVNRTSMLRRGNAGFDPSATLAVHCGNGFDARFEPYQSTRLSRYNAGP